MDSLEPLQNKENHSSLTATPFSKKHTYATHYYKKLTDVIKLLDFAAIDHVINLIRSAWLSQKQIICFGNGGSALTAQHFINDWNKSIFLSSGKPFRGRSLTENMGLVTSYANDLSYQDIFIEQLKNILEPGDLVMGISGSGNSENVLRGIAYANEKGHPTIGLCGFDGGKLKHLAKHIVWIPIHDMQITEDLHFTVGHLVMQSLCQTSDVVY